MVKLYQVITSNFDINLCSSLPPSPFTLLGGVSMHDDLPPSVHSPSIVVRNELRSRLWRARGHSFNKCVVTMDCDYVVCNVRGKGVVFWKISDATSDD